VKLSVGSYHSFSVSGCTVWNALPDYLTNPPLSTERYLKSSYLLNVKTTLLRIRNFFMPLHHIYWLIEAEYCNKV